MCAEFGSGQTVIVTIKDQLTELRRNGFCKNDFVNTFCEISSDAGRVDDAEDDYFTEM